MADSTDMDRLTIKQHNLIASLMVEGSVRRACEATGIKERTAYTWMRQDAFKAEYMHARREAVAQAVARLQQASSAAVGVLAKLMATARSEAVRLGAASKILELAIRSVEIEDLQRRLEELERRFGT